MGSIIYAIRKARENSWQWQWRWPRYETLFIVFAVTLSLVSFWLNYHPVSDLEIKEKYAALVKENSQLKTSVSGKDSEIAALKKQLEEQPKVVYRDKFELR